MKGPARLKAGCTARNADNLKMRLMLKAGREVRVLYDAADQDGWDGEKICAVTIGETVVRVGINPENLEML